MMPITTLILPANRYSAPVRLARAVSDQPPTLEFVIEFFAGHKEKIVLVGVVAILAGLALVAVDLLMAGVVAPFTVQLTCALLAFGVVAIGVGVAAKFLSGELSGDTNNSDRTVGKKTLVKPRGRRCNRAFQQRAPLPLQIPVINTKKETGANQ